jgi:hypothetical protein
MLEVHGHNTTILPCKPSLSVSCKSYIQDAGLFSYFLFCISSVTARPSNLFFFLLLGSGLLKVA